MEDFIVFEHESGEICYIRRVSINSFHPKYTHPRGYLVYVTDGVKEFPAFACETIDEARAWITEQIGLIGGVKKVGK
tara:strand:+ start:2521 stop:2751 length:231 start_codon:yes stop_codon:yes gene_type:complete